MTITISTAFNKTPKQLAKAGVFDVCLDLDAEVFIDPAMLGKTKCPELKGSRDDIVKHFNGVLKLLERSKASEDKMWRDARRRLVFPELKETCLGYSVVGTDGSGIGPELAEQLIQAAKEILDAGIDDPEIFELSGLFEEGIGPDRISDLISGLLADRLAAYTVRVCKTLSIPCNATYKTTSRTYKVPMNPVNKKPLLMVPQDVLRDLPIALDKWTIGEVCLHNAAVRAELNGLVGQGWKLRDVDKRTLRGVLLRNPDALADLIKRYKNTSAPPYDFDVDPASVIRWAWVEHIVNATPLKLAKHRKPSLAQVHETAMKICTHFVVLLQDNGVNELLFVNGKPRPERFAQRLFFSIASSYCTSNDLDLSPESNAGRGPVDFKVSAGAEAKCVVELKLSKNGKLVKGYTTQLATYAKSEKAKRSIYLVVDLGRKSDKTRMNALDVAVKAAKPPKPDLVIAAAKKQKSASKL
ncbi:MAG: hypothetical protein ABIY55_01605 [Kofleriaceae bacterium]